VDGRIKTPVEVLQWFEGVEVGGLGAAFHVALLADIHFVLKDEFQELGMGQAIGGGFLQAHTQSLAQAKEAEFFEGRFEV
jgi:hypothetical protein